MMAQTKSKSRSSHRRIITALHFPNFGFATKPRVPHISLVFCEMWDTTALDPRILEPSPHHRESTGAPRSPKRPPDFLSSLPALAHFMRLSLMKAAHAGVGGAPCRKSGYVGRTIA